MNDAVCFSVIGTQSKVQRSMQEVNVKPKSAQNLKKKHQKLYLFKRKDQYSGQEISLEIASVTTE